MHITAVIPAWNEAGTIGQVVTDLAAVRWQGQPLVQRIIVADNNSSDDTAALARAAGAEVVFEPRQGYGAACLKALSVIQQTDIVLFVNGDGAEHCAEAVQLIQPICERGTDLVIGSRLLGGCEAGALYSHQIWGNRLATYLMALFWGYKGTDLGPFRAIKFDSLTALKMSDQDFGWTIEMQVKALLANHNIEEIAVTTRASGQPSKVAGRISGTLGASYKILKIIILYGIYSKFFSMGRAIRQGLLR